MSVRVAANADKFTKKFFAKGPPKPGVNLAAGVELEPEPEPEQAASAGAPSSARMENGIHTKAQRDPFGFESASAGAPASARAPGMEKSKGGQTIAESDLPAPGEARLVTLELHQLDEHPQNPRKYFDAERLGELVESIRTHGVLTPLIVRAKDGFNTGGGTFYDSFEILAGHRRLRAAREAGLAAVPCLLRQMEDAQALEILLLDNLQRDGLRVLEEAQGFRDAIDSGRFTAESLGQRIGKSRRYVFNRLSLLKLSGPARKALNEGTIDASTAVLIAGVPGEKLQAQLLKEGEEFNFHHDEMQELIRDDYCRNLGQAPWKLEDADLVKTAGACRACPKMSANIPDFEGSANVCTDVGCYGKKLEAAAKIRIAEAKAAGCKVLDADKDWSQINSGKWWVADHEEYIGGKWCKVGPLARKAGVQAGAIKVDHRNWEITDLFEREAVLSALKKGGAKIGHERQESSPSEKRERERSKLQHATVDAAIVKLRASAARSHAEKFFCLIADLICNTAHWDPIRETLSRRGLEQKPGSDRAKPLRQFAEKETDARELIMELLCREFALGSFRVNAPYGDNLTAACKWAGIDLKEIEREVTRAKKKGGK